MQRYWTLSRVSSGAHLALEILWYLGWGWGRLSKWGMMTEIFAERPPVQAAIENGYWLRWHRFDEDGLEDFDYDEDGLEDSNVDLEKAVVGPELRLNFTEVGHVHFIITTTCSTYLLHSTIMSFGFFLHFDFLFHSVANFKRSTIILKSVIT